MRKFVLFLSFIGLLSVTFCLKSCQSSIGHTIDYSTEIKPIINKHCIACHGGVKKAGGFGMLFREDALAITESGKAALVPFKPEASDFIKRLTATDPEERMPYKHEPLQKDEIEKLTLWVKQGAVWGNHWAYLPPKMPEIKKGFFSFWGNDWQQNNIDILVEKVQKEQGLKHQSEAESQVLLRRLCLDLTGLPPSTLVFQRDVKLKTAFDGFLTDNSEKNYQIVVQELLKTPAYGERWASVWLDLARYSDSRGYQKDNERNIWKYRDWVIASLNKDMPYKQFTTEQLAGDLLPNPTKSNLIATAFHRNTMNNDETGTVDEEYRVAAILDRINTTFEVFQGTTIGCVQCHSHPYDPFRHEEYYKLMAFFNNTRDEDTIDEGPFLREFDKISLPKKDSLFAYLKQFEEEKSKPWQNFVAYLEPRFHAHYADSYQNGTLLGDRNIGLFNGGTCRLANIKLDNQVNFVCSFRANQMNSKIEILLDSPNGEVIGSAIFDTTGRKDFSKFISLKPKTGRHDLYLRGVNKNVAPQKEVFSIFWFAFMPEFPSINLSKSSIYKKQFADLILSKTDNTPIMLASNADYLRPTKVFKRGNWLVHGQEVKPATPKALNGFAALPNDRLGLAKWLFEKDNPLTARVMVNRVWEQLFGLGIIETAEDFGTQGAKPSNQALLDYLALNFSNKYQWRFKDLIQEIVLSNTYKQKGTVTKDLLEKDPSNKFLARGPRMRLPAETIRDQALAVSGLLSNKMYGKPVLPYQPDGVWQAVNSSLNYKQSEGEDQYRRAIYTFARRTGPYPSMLSFDAGSRELCLSRRIRTNTPLQSLTLLNDPVFVEASLALAKRVYLLAKTDEEKIEQMYFWTLNKTLSSKKKTALSNLYEKALQDFEKNPLKSKAITKASTQPKLAALAIVANTIINLDEFVVKE